MRIITVHAISKTIKCIEPQLLEEQISKLMFVANAWIEPMRQWLNQASDFNAIVKTAELSAIKETLVKIEGLNLFLKSKKTQLTVAPEISLLLWNMGIATQNARKKSTFALSFLVLFYFGTGGRTRTYEGLRREIYSLLSLPLDDSGKYEPCRL